MKNNNNLNLMYHILINIIIIVNYYFHKNTLIKLNINELIK